MIGIINHEFARALYRQISKKRVAHITYRQIMGAVKKKYI